LTDWDEAVAHALTLPDTVLASYYGKPAVKIASNARAFLSPGHEADAAFCLHLDLDSIDMLKETEPETYFQTPHYEGWGAVLVRYGSADPDRVRAMIARARDQAAAKPPTKPRKNKA